MPFCSVCDARKKLAYWLSINLYSPVQLLLLILVKYDNLIQGDIPKFYDNCRYLYL